MTVDTRRFAIEPVSGDALAEAAAFLDRWRSAGDHGPPDAASSTERRLHWLLVDNPLASDDSYGLCVRDAAGDMAGLLLSFPTAFRAGDHRLMALCSGSYFVAPSARSLGFFLFKRHLAQPGYAFFFSTTCNAESGPIWALLGAEAVPDCDAEYVLPLDLEVVLPAFVGGRTSTPWASRLGRLAGRCANAVRRLAARRTSAPTSEPCRDWDKLAALSRRHRPSQWVTTDRTAPLLQWRYGMHSPHHATDIRVFRDTRGNEGWFALGNTRRGAIRGRVVLDATWPRDCMGFDEVLAAVAAVAPDAHAIYFRPRPGVDYRALGRRIIRRRRLPPAVFAIPAPGATPARVAALDLVLADGDSGVGDGGSW